jgi:hypothetical protein
MCYRLISFSWEGDLLCMLHSLLHMNFQQLLVLDNLLSLALSTFVFFANYLSCRSDESKIIEFTVRSIEGIIN